MIPDRNLFLTALFDSFDVRGIPYCISRNAGETFANTGSDVDLVVSRADLKAAERLCREIAEQQGYRLAMRTRFTNLCLLFWAPAADFVRIDIEPGIRWKMFPVLHASDLLEGRKRDGGLYVPSPEGEAMVLAAKVAWMSKLSERYRNRLEALHEATNGFAMAGADARRIIGFARAGDSAGLRRWLVRNTLSRPSRWPGLAVSILDDIQRMFVRALHPPGVHLRFKGNMALEWDKLSRHLQMGFPSQKSSVFNGNPAPKQALSSLFRGGVVMEQILCEDRASPPRSGGLVRTMADSRNRVVAFRPGNGRIYLAHEASGMMEDHEDKAGEVELHVADFIGKSMTRKHQPSPPGAPGKFIVLVGLDGAGKTTFARNLCATLTEGSEARRVRYFHWIPKLNGRSFPWPSFAETPRKTPAHGPVHGILSVLRLFKNLIHARLVHHFGIRRWVASGDFVIVDRFMFNYWLDPVSLRYNGPSLLLDLVAGLMPKPDIVFSLQAEADTLLSRKEELTREDIARQSALLERLPLHGSRKVILDASLPPEELVRQADLELRHIGLHAEREHLPCPP